MITKFRNSNLVLAVTAATMAALLPVQQSAAEALRTRDSTRDVVKIAIDAGPDAEHIATVIPSRAHGDIVAMRVDHRIRRVVVQLRYRKLLTTARMWHDVHLRTDGPDYDLDFAHTGRRIDRIVSFWNETGDRDVNCPRLNIRVNIELRRVRASIPRRCLQRPQWVRVGVDAYSESRSDFYHDEAMRRGRNDSDWDFGIPRLGPRLGRG